MAEPLKLFFDAGRVKAIADEIHAAHPAFERRAFVRDATRGLDELELVPRARHIAQALARHLPGAFPEAVEVLLRSLGPPLDGGVDHGMGPFHYMPHATYIAERGLDHPELSLAAQREVTKRFSCEFSIRPFIEKHPELTLATLRAWTRDPSEHVRRLVSEGTRPRLPWASRLRSFQEDPKPVLDLLEVLKDDASGYVRRSVANNLNDIAKDHPDVALATCARWLEGASEERRRLVHHALRALVREGHPEAIRLLGGEAGATLEASCEVEPRRVRIGENVRFRVVVANGGERPARAVLGLRIHFVKASGEASPKTFKLPTQEVPAGGEVRVAKTVSLKQHTTRTHYPGEHVVEVVVNGEPRPAGSFTLR